MGTQTDTIAFRGYAAVFNQRTSIGGRFDEVINPGAFKRTLGTKPDVVLRMEHGGLPIARTLPGTLRLREDGTGLLTEADLDSRDSTVRDLMVKYERGDLTGEMSFAFRVPPSGDTWNTDRTLRTISEANLHRGDVSIVTYGAYPGTSSTVRGGSYTLEERRAYAELTSGLLLTRASGPILSIDGIELRSATEYRADYTDAEKAALGKQGKAVYIDGHWAFPTPSRSDFDNAVRALGRTPGKNRATVRKYLIRRAKQEGWPIPSSWQSDGSTKRTQLLPNDTEDLAIDLKLRSVEREPYRPKSPGKLLDSTLRYLDQGNVTGARDSLKQAMRELGLARAEVAPRDSAALRSQMRRRDERSAALPLALEANDSRELLDELYRKRLAG